MPDRVRHDAFAYLIAGLIKSIYYTYAPVLVLVRVIVIGVEAEKILDMLKSSAY
jgi:hypothetical protein